MYFLASKSVTEAYAWVISLVRFIETTYRDYEREKFSTAKAWHVTTSLATKLIVKVYIPRHGIVEQLKIGDARAMVNTIFCSTLKSLDIMLKTDKRIYQSSFYHGLQA